MLRGWASFGLCFVFNSENITTNSENITTYKATLLRY